MTRKRKDMHGEAACVTTAETAETIEQPHPTVETGDQPQPADANAEGAITVELFGDVVSAQLQAQRVAVKESLLPITHLMVVFNERVTKGTMSTMSYFPHMVNDVISLFAEKAVQGVYYDVSIDAFITVDMARYFIMKDEQPEAAVFNLDDMLAATFKPLSIPVIDATLKEGETPEACYQRLCAEYGAIPFSKVELAHSIVSIASSSTDHYLVDAVDRERIGAAASTIIETFTKRGGGASMKLAAAALSVLSPKEIRQCIEMLPDDSALRVIRAILPVAMKRQRGDTKDLLAEALTEMDEKTATR